MKRLDLTLGSPEPELNMGQHESRMITEAGFLPRDRVTLVHTHELDRLIAVDRMSIKRAEAEARQRHATNLERGRR